MPSVEFIIRTKYEKGGSTEALRDFEAMQKRIAELSQQQRALDQSARSQPGLTGDQAILQNLKYTDGLRGLIAEASRMEQVFRKSAASAVNLGEALRGQNLNQVADSYARVRKFGEQLQSNTRETANEWKGFTGVMKDILMPINQVGFAMFLLTSNLRTLQIVAQAAFDVLEEGAARTDVLLAYNRLTDQAGINTGNLTERLQEASDGLITMQTAQSTVNRAILAGLPQLANASPALLNMAKSVAIATGNIQKLDHIYETLILGILRGSPRLIDNADIYIKLGDANEKYAESIGKTVEELTEQEKQLAVLNAVMSQEADVLALAGENVESHAVTWASLKTEMGEVKSFIFALIEAYADLKIDETNELLGINVDLTELLKTSLFGLTSVAILLSEMLKAPWVVLKEGIQEVTPILANFSNVIEALRSKDLSRINSSMEELTASFNNFDFKPGEIIEEATQDAIAQIRELGMAVGLLQNQMNDGTRTTGFKEAFLGPIDEIIASLRFIGSEEYKLQKDLLASWADYREKLEDIEADKNEKLIELKQNLNERLLDLDEDLAEKQEDINEDLAETLADIESDSNKDLSEENENYHKNREKAEEDHQKRINDIMRRFEMARLRAVIDRDARALFEAERQRDESLNEENDSFEDKLADLEENHREEVEKIEEQEEEKRRKAIEAAEERRQDAIDAYNEAREDAIENYEEAQADAIEAYNKARQAAKEAAKERESDLKESYAERLYIAEAGEKLKLALEAKAQLESETNMFDYFLGLKEQVQDYYNFLKEYEDYEFPFAPDPSDLPSLPGSGGTGSNPNPPSGGGNPSGQSPCASGEGGTVPCSTPNQLYSCSDGSKYVCIGGVWRRTYGGGSSTGGNSMVGGGNNITGGIGGNGGQQRVILQVKGDKTLQAVLEELVYDTVIEVMT